MLFSTPLIASTLGEAPGVSDNPFPITCSVTHSDWLSTVSCIDQLTSEQYSHSVEPIQLNDLIARLRENGAVFDEERYNGQLITSAVLRSDEMGNFKPLCFEQIRYTSSEFNRLSRSSSDLSRARAIATALKDAGVCSQAIQRDTTGLNIDVSNNDQLLQHFLCIANGESTFGRGADNIGMGGRGPFGIHPTEHTGRNGICSGLSPIVTAEETASAKRNRTKAQRGASYENATVRRENARCALRLYSRNNYRDWGRSNTSWGTNHECSASQRARFNFERQLGEAACCSEACKRRVRGNRTTSL
ncbi:MAG: hypothetical protein CME71_01615 [Halobacteriovorax sp.]|nr:hypothetical protein [Halobacteriovorax sp.]